LRKNSVSKTTQKKDSYKYGILFIQKSSFKAPNVD